ncbi:MAG: hypothetical protein ACI8W8_001771 [Rhodothermales bacterium]|jgi:hypothetical protein
MWDKTHARAIAIAVLLALHVGAELPGKGIITHIEGSPDSLAMGGRMLAVVADRAITMLDLETASERCRISIDAEFTAASGGHAAVTHQPESGLLQTWDVLSGHERDRRILDLGSKIHMQMGAANARFIAMLWRRDHACAGIFDLETGHLHPIRARDIGELLGMDPDCRQLFIRREDETYRVDLPHPLPKRLDAHPLVSGHPDAWPGGSSLVVDGHVIDSHRQFIAYRPPRGDYVPSLQANRYGWFDNGRRLFHVYRFDGSPVVTIQLGRTGHPAFLTHDRLVMRQRNQQRIYPLTVTQQEQRFLRPGELWVARLNIGTNARVSVPAGMEVDLDCRSVLWTVPANYAREPFQVSLGIHEDGQRSQLTLVVDPLRERSLPDLIRYLWLRLHYDVREGDAVAADQRLAALIPHIDERTPVPLTLMHMAKSALGDHIRSQLAPLLTGDPVAANLLLADVASRGPQPTDAGTYLLAALASRPIIPAHDRVIGRAMAQFAESAELPAEIAEFARDLRARLADVDPRLTKRYSELKRWLEARQP